MYKRQVIWGLAGLKDVRLGLIAQGERQERLRKEGCLINDEVTDQRCGHPKKRIIQALTF